MAYTLSKTIDQGAGVTSGGDELPQSQRGIYGYDMGFKRGLSSQDIRNSFVTNFTYEFPRGDFGGVGNALVNGWQLNGIVTLTDGNPLSITDGSDAQDDAIGSDEQLRADLISGGNNNLTEGVAGSCALQTSRGKELGGRLIYYDPCQFAPSTIGFFGNVGRNTVTSPGLATVDFSLFKDFQISEGSNLQFRAEFFNLFNRANFRSPDTSPFRSRATPDNINDLTSDGEFRNRDSNAGRINETRTPGRQIQFGLRFTF